MNIRLRPDQQEWLDEQIAAGRYGSQEMAISAALDDAMISAMGDLSWAKPLVDEGIEDIRRGNTISGEKFFAWLDERRRQLREE